MEYNCVCVCAHKYHTRKTYYSSNSSVGFVDSAFFKIKSKTLRKRHCVLQIFLEGKTNWLLQIIQKSMRPYLPWIGLVWSLPLTILRKEKLPSFLASLTTLCGDAVRSQGVIWSPSTRCCSNTVGVVIDWLTTAATSIPIRFILVSVSFLRSYFHIVCVFQTATTCN